MEWLFERTIEVAAWFAFVLALIFCGGAVWSFILWARSSGADAQLLVKAGYAAGGFIASAIALGSLACIDRYVFDLPDETES